MESELIKMALSQGIWSVLSIFLIFYILKTQEKRDIKQEEREQNYQAVIESLNDNLISIKDIQLSLTEIKEKIFEN